jgi:hypothetical protein
MRWILRLLQRISRWRRRIFGSSTPHWLKDGLSVIGFVNVLDLMPTLLGTVLSPRHFYTRIPQIIAEKRTWYKSPIKFLTSGVSLIVILLFYFDFDILEENGLTDKTLVARYLFVICLVAPLLIPLIALIFRIGLGIIFSIPGLSQSSAGLSPILITLMVPLSPWTYARLDYRHFLWSVFYFGVYFYIALQIYQLIGFYIIEYGGEVADFVMRKADRCLSHVDDLVRISNNTLRVLYQHSSCLAGLADHSVWLDMPY